MYFSIASIKAFVREALLIEGKVDDLIAANPGVDVALLAEGDPSPTKKYLAWMIKQSTAGNDDDEIVSMIRFFHAKNKRFENRDINAYKTLEALKSEIDRIKNIASSTQQKASAKSGGAKLFEDDNTLLVRVDTRQSCQLYGANTKWCITSRDAAHFEEYSSSNTVFYFLIDKQAEPADSMSKVAIVVPRSIKSNDVQHRSVEFYDAKDKNIPAAQVAKYFASDRAAQLISLALLDAGKQPQTFLARLTSGIGGPIPLEDIKKHVLTLKAPLEQYSFLISTFAELTSDPETKRYRSEIVELFASLPTVSEEVKETADGIKSGLVTINNGILAWHSAPKQKRQPGKKITRKKASTFHRDGDKPAIIDSSGTIMYYKNGKIHRDGDKPAYYNPQQQQTIWYKDGQRHRDGDKPAVLTPRAKVWYKEGQIHRDGDKPAIIEASGAKHWYENGAYLSLQYPKQERVYNT